ncbi:16S rRNA (adenine(1518)-N(6)/adenine(1519)-N(6))-dimethyltransferase RsmA [Rubrobacter calidifluminis]|uniref:16S rRNA (adenine(1518)-N(6)/adenine(1519)-N(6))- dimethyltransferase RsmA n=1 Tax=Rubrobacter calidifluminis TaxID=1392640 RepID=UPI0023621FFC|nr:16S rRNA (adenine(1518)-N(6)/adenine(1519)-N(6))-dimethyltransferase RsmA [Rubrobacter calidifluminis]
MTRPERPKKHLGQHFLKDPNTARIVAGGITREDVVLEIGAGRGFLTAFLAERARLVHAVELDRDVIPALREAVRDRENVIVHRADALRMDFSSLRPLPNRLAANLPYNIASPLVLRLLEEAPFVGWMRFMVQLEVARRMASRPGSKDYAAYAVLMQLLGEVRIVHRVPPSVFEPPPRVWSAVVEVRRRERPEDYEAIKEFVLAVFSSRRKRLVNNLPHEVRDRTEVALRELGRHPDVRAEELQPEELAALHRASSS